MPDPTYLDDQGNPIYLDDNGNPISSTSGTQEESWFDTFANAIPDSIKDMASRALYGVHPDVVDPTRGEESILPSIKGMADVRAASGTSFNPYMEGFLSSIYEDFIRPFGTPSGFVGMAQPMKGMVRPEVLPPEAPPIRGMLPQHENPFIAGPGGVQRADIITPQEEARLAGYDFLPEGGPIEQPFMPANIPKPLSSGPPPADVVDLGQLRELERQKALNYTGFEHEGGVPLVLENRPNMAQPPVSGDISLGFNPQSQADLPYPLNVVPNAVRPRSAQAVTEALAGEDFARQVLPNEPVTFESAPIQPEVKAPPTRDLRGGTAALEPGEPILPSALKARKENVKANTGLNISNIKIPPEVPKEIAEPIAKGVDNFVKEASQPSILMKSVYTQLARTGPKGKELVQRFQRAAQKRAEYDAVWTEPLFSTGAKLSKKEFDNFGAYVEGRMPVPNARVQNAVDEWTRAQNMMGDMAVSKQLHMKRGEEIIPFQKIESGYWPHIPVEQLTKKTIVDKLMAGGMSRHEAAIVAKRWENTGEIFLGPQHSRLNNTFQYRDDFDIALHHGRSMSKRIANHEELGPKDIAGRNEEGIANLIEDTNDPKLTYKLAKRLAGREELPNERLVNGLNLVRKSMSLTKLPSFTLPNVILGQAMNAFEAFASNHPIAAAKEVFKLFNATYRSEIRAAGVYNSFNRTLLEEIGSWRNLDPFLIGTGEKINRSIAAAVGRSTIREVFKDYKAGVNTKAARYYIETLLARDPDSITAITPELERFAAGRMAEITQGLNNPGNLPYGWSNPINTYGSAATQLLLIFKKIGFQTTKTVKDTIMANPKVAIPAWLAISQVAGEMVGDVKSMITGKERPEELINRIANNWGNAFMLGLPWDLVTSAQYGPAGLLSSALGPVYGGISELMFTGYQVGKNLANDEEDPFRPLRRQGIRNIPLPGRERLLKEED